MSPIPDRNLAQQRERDAARRKLRQTPRSSQPIAPPAFLRLRTEAARARPRYRHPDTLPPVLQLDEHSRCSCGRLAQPDDEIQIAPCVIYATEGVFRRQIERKRCPCRTTGDVFSAGPDLGALSLFNWNNKVIFTHEIMNGFACGNHTSKMTVAAYYSNVFLRYQDIGVYGSVADGKDQTARRLWLVERLSQLRSPNSASCRACHPEHAIYKRSTTMQHSAVRLTCLFQSVDTLGFGSRVFTDCLSLSCVCYMRGYTRATCGVTRGQQARIGLNVVNCSRERRRHSERRLSSCGCAAFLCLMTYFTSRDTDYQIVVQN